MVFSSFTPPKRLCTFNSRFSGPAGFRHRLVQDRCTSCDILLDVTSDNIGMDILAGSFDAGIHPWGTQYKEQDRGAGVR